jgi:hypothetical protein
LKTLIGALKSDLHVNDVGNPYLHKRHKVGFTQIDDSKISRAVVYDQHIIDRLFTTGQIDSQQHNSLNTYLEMISKSGALGTAVSLDQKTFAQNIFLLPRATLLLAVQKFLYEVTSRDHEKILWRIMVKNPNKIKRIELSVVQETSDALQNFWGSSQESPVSLFQQAFLNPSS